MRIILAFIAGVLIVKGLASMSESHCPKCGHELEDAGYEGWKRWCKKCGYRNYGDKK